MLSGRVEHRRQDGGVRLRGERRTRLDRLVGEVAVVRRPMAVRRARDDLRVQGRAAR